MTVTGGVGVAVGELTGVGVAACADGRAGVTACVAPHALKRMASTGAISRIGGIRILARGFYEPAMAESIGRILMFLARRYPLRKPWTRGALLSDQLSLDASSEGRAAA